MKLNKFYLLVLIAAMSVTSIADDNDDPLYPSGRRPAGMLDSPAIMSPLEDTLGVHTGVRILKDAPYQALVGIEFPAIGLPINRSSEIQFFWLTANAGFEGESLFNFEEVQTLKSTELTLTPISVTIDLCRRGCDGNFYQTGTISLGTTTYIEDLSRGIDQMTRVDGIAYKNDLQFGGDADHGRLFVSLALGFLGYKNLKFKNELFNREFSRPEVFHGGGAFGLSMSGDRTFQVHLSVGGEFTATYDDLDRRFSLNNKTANGDAYARIAAYLRYPTPYLDVNLNLSAQIGSMTTLTPSVEDNDGKSYRDSVQYLQITVGASQ